MENIIIVIVAWRLMQIQMRQSTFYEEESIVPLHKKLSYNIVYSIYNFMYNVHAKSGANGVR